VFIKDGEAVRSGRAIGRFKYSNEGFGGHLAGLPSAVAGLMHVFIDQVSIVVDSIALSRLSPEAALSMRN
jgi:hypothetical protein